MGGKRAGEWLAALLGQLLDRLASDSRPSHQQQRVRRHLREAWKEWLGTWRRSQDETGLLLVRTVELCAGRFHLVSGGGDDSVDFDRLARLLSSICKQLRLRQKLSSLQDDMAMAMRSKSEREEEEEVAEEEEEEERKELAECVLQGASETKKTFLAVAKSFYYAARCPPPALSAHISDVLFRPLQL